MPHCLRTATIELDDVFGNASFGQLAGDFWVGDDEGRFADSDGPSASELLWRFFQQHDLAPD